MTTNLLIESEPEDNTTRRPEPGLEQRLDRRPVRINQRVNNLENSRDSLQDANQAALIVEAPAAPNTFACPSQYHHVRRQLQKLEQLERNSPSK